ncbi:polymer-forming cytoskeletal protein [Candidatus Saccharibacteria bacterium]|nr:polymer-forming cytoskeletal protein [Candidatus Saccharibacteria bacterium]
MAKSNKKTNNIIEPETLEETSSVIEPTSTSGNFPAQKESELSDAAVGADTAPHRPSRVRRFLSFSNLYLVIFLLLVGLVAAGVFVSTRLDKTADSDDTKPQSLTDKQLSELKGSTTVIGDSDQILDIQSDAVFEGQVLMRNNLDVAGTVKVGGPLSLSAVTVGGSSNFGNVQVNGTLSVAGNTTLQGPVTLQRSLAVVGSASFSGTVSTSQLNVSNLQLTGDLVINRHIALGGPAPGRTNGSALGGGGTASVGGTDTAGTVTINTGSSPPAGCFVTVNFTNKFNTTPHVIISPSNSNSAGLNYHVNRSTTNFSVCVTNVPTASTSYSFDYIVID